MLEAISGGIERVAIRRHRNIETSDKTMTTATNKSCPKMIMKVLITKVWRFVDHAQTFH